MDETANLKKIVGISFFLEMGGGGGVTIKTISGALAMKGRYLTRREYNVMNAIEKCNVSQSGEERS